MFNNFSKTQKVISCSIDAMAVAVVAVAIFTPVSMWSVAVIPVMYGIGYKIIHNG